MIGKYGSMIMKKVNKNMKFFIIFISIIFLSSCVQIPIDNDNSVVLSPFGVGLSKKKKCVPNPDYYCPGEIVKPKKQN